MSQFINNLTIILGKQFTHYAKGTPSYLFFISIFRLLIELLIQVYFTALFTFKGYNFQYKFLVIFYNH